MVFLYALFWRNIFYQNDIKIISKLVGDPIGFEGSRHKDWRAFGRVQGFK